MPNYDQQYQEEDLFGQPYPEFVDFMDVWQPKGTVLDIGCGQGRDSLFLARQGYQVTGIDASEVGIKQMLEQAEAKGLNVKGIVADFYSYDYAESFDIVVLDSILHFGSAEKAKELELLHKLCLCLNDEGIICLFVHKSNTKEKVLKGFFNEHFSSWEVLKDTYIDYTYFEKATNFTSSFQYHMFITRKVR